MIYIARDNRQQVKVSLRRMKWIESHIHPISNYWDSQSSSLVALPFIWLQNDDFPQVKKGEQWALDTETLQMERIEAHE